MHRPVLADEAIHWLRIREDGVYVDCTAGAGGHAERIAQRIPRGRLIALDRDPVAVRAAADRLRTYPCAVVAHRNYDELAAALAEFEVGQVDGILIDAGVSSMQLDESARGFSFQQEGPLDMRMDTTRGMTAAEYLQTVDGPALAGVLKEYGDVGPARRIADTIVRRRNSGRLETTRDLAEAVAEALPFVHGAPAETRQVFQAIRMAVNDELGCLHRCIDIAMDALAPEGRLVAISFHSGEDRVVKRALAEASRVRRELALDGRVRRTIAPRMRLLTRTPVVPGADELARNPRAHSAKLRAAERLPVSEETPS